MEWQPSLCVDILWGYMLWALIEKHGVATHHVSHQGGFLSLNGSPACVGAKCCRGH